MKCKGIEATFCARVLEADTFFICALQVLKTKMCRQLVGEEQQTALCMALGHLVPSTWSMLVLGEGDVLHNGS